jgi:hypothetical protein
MTPPAANIGSGIQVQELLYMVFAGQATIPPDMGVGRDWECWGEGGGFHCA